MFGGLPRLLLLVLVIIAVLYAMRQFNTMRYEQKRREVPRVQPRPQPRPSRPVIEAEELAMCGVCRTYLAASAPNCGRPGCPRPR
jgi:hypothetical protein